MNGSFYYLIYSPAIQVKFPFYPLHDIEDKKAHQKN